MLVLYKELGALFCKIPSLYQTPKFQLLAKHTYTYSQHNSTYKRQRKHELTFYTPQLNVSSQIIIRLNSRESRTMGDFNQITHHPNICTTVKVWCLYIYLCMLCDEVCVHWGLKVGKVRAQSSGVSDSGRVRKYVNLVGWNICMHLYRAQQSSRITLLCASSQR